MVVKLKAFVYLAFVSEFLELGKVHVRFLISKTFKTVGSVLKGVFQKAKKYFIKYFITRLVNFK